jgi:hypothetical protein
MDLPCSHLQAAVSTGLPADGAYREDGPSWMESRLRPRTAAMDGLGFCETYCHSSFYNSMRQFYNIIHMMSFLLPFPWETFSSSLKIPLPLNTWFCPRDMTVGQQADGTPVEEWGGGHEFWKTGQSLPWKVRGKAEGGEGWRGGIGRQRLGWVGSGWGGQHTKIGQFFARLPRQGRAFPPIMVTRLAPFSQHTRIHVNSATWNSVFWQMGTVKKTCISTFNINMRTISERKWI